jgi:hypothetical protein
MTSTNTLDAVVAALDEAGIPHMLAGSFASSLHGLARTTADIDIVIDPSASTIETFIANLDRDRYYVDDAAAREAARSRAQFHVIDLSTGWKVDLIVVKDRAFSTTEFERRLSVTILGVPVFVATAEDTVLAKLEWSKLGESERQLRDVVDILRMRQAELDDTYLDRWAVELGISDLLGAARQAARG